MEGAKGLGARLSKLAGGRGRSDKAQQWIGTSYCRGDTTESRRRRGGTRG